MGKRLFQAGENEDEGGEVPHYLQIFQISAGELGVCDDLNLAVALLADYHRVAQVPDPILDFDLVVQELFKRGDVENLVRCWLGGVDDVLYIARQKELAA